MGGGFTFIPILSVLPTTQAQSKWCKWNQRRLTAILRRESKEWRKNDVGKALHRWDGGRMMLGKALHGWDVASVRDCRHVCFVSLKFMCSCTQNSHFTQLDIFEK